jgi:hypothetical protein
MGTGQVAARTLLLIQLGEDAALHHDVAHLVVFLLGTVTPNHILRLCELGEIFDPCQQFLMLSREFSGNSLLGCRFGSRFAGAFAFGCFLAGHGLTSFFFFYPLVSSRRVTDTTRTKVGSIVYRFILSVATPNNKIFKNEDALLFFATALV